MALTFSAAADLDFERLAQAFTAGYEGYIVPVVVDAEWMGHHVSQNHIRLDASRLAWDGDQIVGVGLLGVRGRRGWIGGIGICTAYRGKGAGRDLMGALLDAARENGLEHVQLEVIIGNEHAYQLYLKLGFKVRRRLLVLNCKEAPNVAIDDTIKVEMGSPEEALKYFSAFHTVPNPWQRELDQGQSLTRLAGWYARRNGQTLAYAVGQATDQVIRFSDMTFAPGEADALRTLIAVMQRHGLNASFVNLAEDDPVWPVLSALGYRETLSQYEMHLAL